MPYNGSGSFTTSDTIENGTLGDATEVQNILTDIANGLTNCVTKDGQQTVTNNIPMNSFKFTGMANGLNRTDSATIGNLQEGTGTYLNSSDVSGTGNAITLFPTPAIGSYAEGQRFRFIVVTSNSSAVTVAVSGLAAKAVHSKQGTDLISGDLVSGSLAEITYDGTRFILTGGGAASSLTSKTITNCTLVTCTASANPTADLGLATKQYVDAMWTTGDVKVTLKTTADSGWVMFNDGTIGSASSGATTRANADTEDLFTLLWNNTADANCAVSGGRGATAAADFSANKTIALPKVLGRALAIAGAGSGLTSRALAAALGTEDAVNVSHTHTITDPGHTHFTEYNPLVAGGVTALNVSLANTDGSGNLEDSASFTGISINSSGASGTGANMQPSSFFNIMVKL